MIKITYENIVERIEKEAGVKKEEIESRVNKKLEQLSGLVSREGAAHIVANELGIKLFEQASGKLKIKDVISGMSNVEVVGKIIEIKEPVSFSTQNRTGEVSSFLIGDETGSIRIVLWNEQAVKVKELKQDGIVKIMGGYVRDRNNRKEIHLNPKSRLIISPENEEIKEVKTFSNRKQISEIIDGDDTEVAGTIVQVFEPRFFEICPECGKRIREKEGQFMCEAHGLVEPAYAYVMNATIDDGTDSVRSVFFRKQAQSLLGRIDSEILKYRDNPVEFEAAKTELIGESIKINGRVSKNDMFGRMEIIANSVAKIDIEEEVRLLQKELKK